MNWTEMFTTNDFSAWMGSEDFSNVQNNWTNRPIRFFMQWVVTSIAELPERSKTEWIKCVNSWTNLTPGLSRIVPVQTGLETDEQDDSIEDLKISVEEFWEDCKNIDIVQKLNIIKWYFFTYCQFGASRDLIFDIIVGFDKIN